MHPLVTADEIVAKGAVIDPIFLDSPLMRHPALDTALGCAVTLKIETLNPIRSFKGRGTEAVLAALAPRPPAVVTASSGNFGQGGAADRVFRSPSSPHKLTWRPIAGHRSGIPGWRRSSSTSSPIETRRSRWPAARRRRPFQRT